VGCSYLQCIYIIHAHISQDGWTALHLAAQEGHEDVVELLLESKANLKLKTEVINLQTMATLCRTVFTMQSIFVQTDSNPLQLIAYLVDHEQLIVMGLVHNYVEKWVWSASMHVCVCSVCSACHLTQNRGPFQCLGTDHELLVVSIISDYTIQCSREQPCTIAYAKYTI